ncbi:MAG: hypothetical protein ACR2HO_06385 [Rubrobacteraceae bacterium]|nr:hypothetical protein [Rubrobacter sp.]
MGGLDTARLPGDRPDLRVRGRAWLAVARELRAPGRASAVVTDIRYSTIGSGTDSSIVASPVVRFTLPDGRTVEAEAMAVDHPGSKWRRKGAETTVVYDPANLTSVATEGATKGGRVLYGCFVAFETVFTLIGLAVIALGTSRSSRSLAEGRESCEAATLHTRLGRFDRAGGI